MIGIREYRSLQREMQTNDILAQELEAIDGFTDACALAEQGRTLLDTIAQPEPVPMPTTAAEATEEWLNTAASFETTAAQSQARRNVLVTLITGAEQDAVFKAESAGPAMLRHLHDRLTDTLEQVRSLKNLSGVHTAADAIVKDHNDHSGAVEAWQALTALSAVYENIRDAQRRIMVLFFSHELAIHSNTQSRDPLASDLHAQNLDAVWAPNWRDRTDTPWPTDPVERVLWLARSNAQPWVPTPGQLKRVNQERIDEARARAATKGNGINTQTPAGIGIYK